MSNCSQELKQEQALVLTGATLIAEERLRQIEEEGFCNEHDSKFHKRGELAQLACYYAWPHKEIMGQSLEKILYPMTMSKDFAKRSSKDRIRQLEISGALCAAEIDRILANSDDET